MSPRQLLTLDRWSSVDTARSAASRSANWRRSLPPAGRLERGEALAGVSPVVRLTLRVLLPCRPSTAVNQKGRAPHGRGAQASSGWTPDCKPGPGQRGCPRGSPPAHLCVRAQLCDSRFQNVSSCCSFCHTLVHRRGPWSPGHREMKPQSQVEPRSPQAQSVWSLA